MKSAAAFVHVVDNDKAALQQTVVKLRDQGFMVQPWNGISEFIGQSHHVPPGCVVLDLCQSDIDGAAVQRHLNNDTIVRPIVVLTTDTDRELAVNIMRGGAVDVIIKPGDALRLANAVGAALTRIAKAQRHATTKRWARERLDLLSGRENETLIGLTRGLSNKEIARVMGISSRTVEIHRARLMEKLEASSLAQALVISFIANRERYLMDVINIDINRADY